jgi:hypothetical protein
MWKAIAVSLAYAWALYAGWILLYYGSFVLRVPDNPLGNEAQLGALLGFIYSLPAWAVLGGAALLVRKERRVLAVLLVAPSILGVAFFATVYAVVWHAGVA